MGLYYIQSGNLLAKRLKAKSIDDAIKTFVTDAVNIHIEGDKNGLNTEVRLDEIGAVRLQGSPAEETYFFLIPYELLRYNLISNTDAYRWMNENELDANAHQDWPELLRKNAAFMKECRKNGVKPVLFSLEDLDHQDQDFYENIGE